MRAPDLCRLTIYYTIAFTTTRIEREDGYFERIIIICLLWALSREPGNNYLLMATSYGHKVKQ